jgi:hypothetical protein
MGAADQPYRYGATREALSSIAKADAINRGLKGKAADDYVQEYMNNPPQEAMERAVEEGRFATFQNDTRLGNIVAGAKSSLRQKGHDKTAAILDFFVPFVNVPAAVATRMITRTPVGTAAEFVKQIARVRAGKDFDQRAMAQAIGEGTAGVPVIAAGYALYNSGLLTGGYPADKKERELWEAEGKQPNSVKIGDRWVSLNYLQPFGVILNIGAGMAEAKMDEQDILGVINNGVANASNSLLSMSFLEGVSGVIDAAKNPQQYAADYIENTASSVVPNFVRSFGRSIDPLQRDTEGVVEGLVGGIPFARETLTPKTDMFGAPLEAKDNFANQFFNPFKPSQARDDDPVALESRRLQDADFGVIPSQLKANTFGNDIKLEDRQVQDLNAQIGQKVHEAWGQITSAPTYQKLTDEEKANALKAASKDISAAVKSEYAAQNNLPTDSKLTGSQGAIAKGTVNFANYAKGGSVSGLPKNYDALDDNVKKFYDTKLGVSDKDAWEAESVDESGQDLIRRVNQIRAEGMPELPATNKVASLYAEFVSKRDSEKWTPTREIQEKRKLLKEAYKSSLDENDSFWLGANDGLFRQGIEAGDITEDMFGRLLAYDNLQVQLGGSQQIGKKLRSLLGVAQPPNAGPYSSGSSGKTPNYKSFETPISILTKYATQGANLARTASLKR